jgi:hypothetical protein
VSDVTQTGDGPGVDTGEASQTAELSARAPVPVPSSPLAAALAKLQAELPAIAKDQTATVPTKGGGEYSYTYADLAAISAVVLPRLGNLGLSFTARPTYSGDRFVLAYSLLHESGERLDGEYPLPTGGTPQALGSAITYGRRYSLCAVTGVATTDDDDDAAAAAGRAQRAEDDMQHAVDAVRGAWSLTFGNFDQAAAERHYAKWTNGGNLRAAGAAELRRYAAYLTNLPAADAGSDPDKHLAEDRPQTDDSPRPLTNAQRTKINAILSPLYGKDRKARLGALSALLGRTVESSSDLSFAEAQQVIDELEQNERDMRAKSSAGSGVDADKAPARVEPGQSDTPRTGEPAPADPTSGEDT